MATTVGTATVHTRAIMAQDSTGRFIAHLESAAHDTLDILGKRMQTRARRYAPVRTGKLRASLRFYFFSPGEVRVTTSVPYARYQEEGTKPHQITGWVNFYWEKQGRRWVPGPNKINHPGNPPKWFMKRAFEETYPEAREVLRRQYNR